jgi:vacuolar-type H+-ATPase subunit F/Vma7
MTVPEKIKQIAVIGAKEDVLPFMSLGGDVFITSIADQARDALASCAENGYALILISDDLTPYLDDLIEKYASSPLPCITAIPGISGRALFSEKKIRSRIRKAVGIDIEGII